MIPLSIGVSTVLNGTLGLAMTIALLFCMPSDIPDTLDAVTFYPFMSIYTYAVGSKAGATAMVSPELFTPCTTSLPCSCYIGTNVLSPVSSLLLNFLHA